LTAQEALQHKWFKIHKNRETKQPKFLKKRNLNSFKKFMHGCKIQQAALTCIACQASPEDIKNLKETFKALDKDGNGTITIEELKTGLGHKEDADTLVELLKGADTDGSGSIDYTEFIAATLDAQTFMRNDYLRTAFDMFDKDKSGKIDKSELIQLLGGEEMSNLVPQEQIM
jgi:calcium-dependent protein kinase